METAEDVVQEAMIEALSQWSLNGVPDNPVGWIYKVARNKAVNVVNRDLFRQKYVTEVSKHLQSEWTVEPMLNLIFSDNEIADDQLRMIFTCCHSSVSSDSQIALALKTLCGFSITEIAKSYLTTNDTISKRLVRARSDIRKAKISFEVPSGKELDERLGNVLETIYLLFNEGYNSSTGDELIRFELCKEAIRLAEIVASNTSILKKSKVYGLLALMLLNASRFNSRVDENNNSLDLTEQDRSKWDAEMIEQGLKYLGLATLDGEASSYLMLGTISAHHCTAGTVENTNWQAILDLYDNLMILDFSPVVLLNRAVVIYKISGAQKGLEAVNEIGGDLESYLPYYTVKAELQFQASDVNWAVETLGLALNLNLSKLNKSLVYSRLESYLKNK